ncbi:MAG TPA: tetratricopeptide repeat protein [Bryobacteraceae bacterium]|nr:tetratricopeptide repeat protein [Bryobacteraceae bacterium]
MRDKCIASGNKYFQSGKYKEASILYRRALQFDPKSGEAYYRLGLVDLALREYGDAARALERATSLDPGNEEATVGLAELYITAYAANPKSNKHSLDEAKPLVAQVLKWNPKSFGGLRLEADLAILDNDRETAIAKLREANEVKPWQPEVIVPLMQNLAATGRATEAEKLGEEFLARDKTVRRVYDLLFVHYRQSSQFDRAEETLKTEIANLPSDATPRLELAGFYYTRNRRPEMLAVLEGLRAAKKTFPHADSLIGDFYLRMGAYDSGMQAYREGEKQDPKMAADYEKRIADVLLAQGRGQEALAVVSKLHKDYPHDVEAAAIHASLLAKGDRQQVQTAIAELEQLTAKEPGNAMLHFHLARAYWMQGDPLSLDKAAQHFETSLKLNPDSLLAKQGLARIRLEQGQNGVAVQIADEILETNPSNLQAKLIRGTGLANLGEGDKAREELRSILNTHQESNDARYQLAALDLREKRYSEAEAGFRALTQAGDPRGATGLADSKMAQGQTSAALKILEQELAKHPERDGYRLALSEVQLRMGKLQEARAQLEQVVRRKPDWAEALTRLGTVERQLGDKAGALQNFQKAHERQPANPSTTLGYAMLLEAVGKAEQARGMYEEVLKTDPENPTALNNLAYLNAEQGVNLDQALGYAQHALQRSPQDPNISDTLGLIYIRKKLTSQAVLVLQDLVARVPDNPSFHLHLGMALLDAGEKQLAKKELEKAMQHKPSAAEQAKIKDLVARIG